MDGEDLREASKAQWSGVAGGWAEGVERRENGPAGAAADWMLAAAALEPGERVLELACGAGDVGLRAAERVGPTGRVVCSDFAEPMVDVARERARTAGLEDILIEDVASERRHDSLDDWWAETRRVSGPIGALLSKLADEQVAAIRDHAFTHARPYVTGDGVRFPASIVAAAARAAGP